MAHEFESGVFYGKSAWHGLGVTLEDGDARRRSLEGTLTAAGLDWTVSRHAMAVASGPAAGEVVGDRFAIVRDSDSTVLGTVGKRYSMLQNQQMFEWFQPFLDSGAAEFETAGSLHNGKVVWILARLTDVADGDVGGGDMVRPYLMLTSSHNGTLATQLGFTPIRVVCWNTLSAATRASKSQLLKVRHTKCQFDALKLIQETVNTVTCQFEATLDQYKAMKLRGVRPADVQRYVRLVFDLPPDGEIGRARQEVVDQIVKMAVSGIGQDPTELTAWSAYNGVTQYLSWAVGRSANNRLASVWTGSNAKVNQNALQLALSL